MVIEKIDDRGWPLHVSRLYARCIDRKQRRERIPIIRFGKQAASKRDAAGKMLGNSRAMIAVHDNGGLLQHAAAVERIQQVIEHAEHATHLVRVALVLQRTAVCRVVDG